MITEQERKLCIGWNEPDTRAAQDKLATKKSQRVEVSALWLYLILTRYHDIEDMAYRRDWEGLETYCPRTDDEA
ncbi:hypothetical protein AAFN60_01940 [Roseibacillus persicicus]|uniref:hypothetical protein n=1 Tax=Roseibacillus persicicus TaxID=454148 RepID=UPI00398B8642